MNREQVKEMLKLVHESPNVYVASIDCEGYPNIKCIIEIMMGYLLFIFQVICLH